MERIMRLPLLLSYLAAVIAGVVSYVSGADNQVIYLRMALMMLIFFLLGMFVRNTVLSLKNELQVREIEQKKREKQNEKVQNDERKADKSVVKSQQDDNAESQEQSQSEVLFTMGEDISSKNADDFEPLVLSKAIKTKINE
jgi:cell division protein FtsB